MVDQKENTRNKIPDFILIVMFLLFALSISNHDSGSDSGSDKNTISHENILIQGNAVINTDTPVVSHQKTWISGIKYPTITNYSKSLIAENRKTDNRISIQLDLTEKTITVPLFIIHCHMFSSEKNGQPYSG